MPLLAYQLSRGSNHITVDWDQERIGELSLRTRERPTCGGHRVSVSSPTTPATLNPCTACDVRTPGRVPGCVKVLILSETLETTGGLGREALGDKGTFVLHTKDDDAFPALC